MVLPSALCFFEPVGGARDVGGLVRPSAAASARGRFFADIKTEAEATDLAVEEMREDEGVGAPLLSRSGLGGEGDGSWGGPDASFVEVEVRPVLCELDAAAVEEEAARIFATSCDFASLEKPVMLS